MIDVGNLRDVGNWRDVANFRDVSNWRDVGFQDTAVVDLFNGFNRITGDSFSGGPTIVPDNSGIFRSVPAGALAIQGARIEGGVCYPTASDGSALWPSTNVRTRKGSLPRYDSTLLGFLNEPARTNLALGSNLFGDGTYWSGNTSFALTTVNPLIDGTVSHRHQNDGLATFRGRQQNVGTFTAAADTFWTLLENVNASVSVLSLYDVTTASHVCRVQLDWTTEVGSVVAGTGTVHVRKIAGVGPNGGKVFLLGVTATGTSGNSRRGNIYPTGTTTNTQSAIIHHASLNAGVSFPLSPIVTTNATATRAATTYTRPKEGVLRPNNVGGRIRVVPSAEGQTNTYLLVCSQDSTNELRVLAQSTTVGLSKAIGGATFTVTRNYTPVRGVPFEVDWYLSSTYGMGIRTREYSGGQWGAWSAWSTSTDTQDVPLGSLYRIGHRGSSQQFAGHFPFLQIIQHSDPRAELERIGG